MDLVWHYTDGQALMSTIKNQELWASDGWYMNDASEFQYTLNLAQTLLNTEDHKRAWHVRILDLRTYAGNGSPSVCLACFSSAADDLSQWRAYAPLGGFALGFHRSKLKERAEQVGGRFEACEYCRTKQVETLKKALESAEQSAYAVPHDGLTPERISQKFFPEMDRVVPIFKDTTFASEKETRIVVVADSSRLDYRGRVHIVV